MKTIERKIDALKIDLKNERRGTPLKFSSKKHAGSIVESIIRKQGHNISKLARYMNISRCTLYNWFEQDSLPFDILVRIGSYINYDFSTDFPEIYSITPNLKSEIPSSAPPVTENEKAEFWIRKYIHLLEKYNECLINQNNISEA